MRRRSPVVVIVFVSVLACSSARQPPAEESAATGCTGCHGDPATGNAAPPRAVNGATDTTDLRVGAHQRHVNASLIRQAIACSECHVVPATVEAPGHVDKDVADLAWGPVANAGNVSPTPPNGPAPATGTLTCTNWCHGGGFAPNDGSLHDPSWTVVDGSQVGCGTCHGIPPPPPHPVVPATATVCATCHPDTIDASGRIDVAGGKHIDGNVDVLGGCTACHGDPARAPGTIAAAPPRDTHGETATTAAGVGAHQAHLAGGALAAPIACSQCHRVPTDSAHALLPLDLTFGSVASIGAVSGVSPTFDPVALTCANYCHGSTMTGGAAITPTWTLGSSQVACGSCHGLPPASGRHQLTPHTLVPCGACHGLGYTSSSVVAATHVDGVKTVGGASSAISAWDPTPPGTCTSACHTSNPRTWTP